MKQAVKGASKWLIEHTKSNPISFKLFKSILDKQIEWAGKNRGRTLNFNELADSVRAELLAHGIYTVSENGISNQPSQSQNTGTVSLFDDKEKNTGEISPLILSLNDDKPKFTAMLKWLYDVFAKAQAERYSEITFSARLTDSR